MNKTFLVVLLIFSYCRADDGDDPKDPVDSGDANGNGDGDNGSLDQATNPYLSVGKCRDEFNNYAIKRPFSIDELAGQGDYAYLYSSTNLSECATARIDKSKDRFGKPRYIGSATLYSKDLQKHTTYTYENHPTSVNGYIQEVQKIGKTSYTFTLIVRDYEANKGVLSYIRCSDYGQGSKDLRSIVVKIWYAGDLGALTQVGNYFDDDKTQFGNALTKNIPCRKNL